MDSLRSAAVLTLGLIIIELSVGAGELIRHEALKHNVICNLYRKDSTLACTWLLQIELRLSQ